MPTSHNDLNTAIQYHQCGNLKQAEEIYKNLICQNPDDINALYFLGLLSTQQRNYTQALVLLKKVLLLNPEDVVIKDIYSTMGEIYLNLNDMNMSISYFREALKIDPSDFVVHYNLGNIYLHLNQLDNAIESYNKALIKEPKSVEVYKSLIELYIKTDNIDEIIRCYQKLIGLEPNNAENYFNIGVYLNKKGDIVNAHNAYLNAIHLKSDMIVAYINLGDIYFRTREFIKAKEIFLKVLELDKNRMEAFACLSNVYIDLGEAQNAIDLCDRGLISSPGDAALLFNLYRALMLKGDIDKGWEYFKYRKLVNARSDLKTYLLDNNASLKGKRVIVYHDTGFGDSLQFLRYVSLLKDMGAEVTLQIQNPLLSLVKENYPQINVVSTQEDLTKINHDFHINLISLAYLFKRDKDKVPFKEGYIKANPDKVQEYKDKYFNNEDFKIGITWYSHVNTYDKDIVKDLEAYYPLSKINGVKVYSLQVTEGKLSFDSLPEDVRIENLGDGFKDFSETAAAIENLDLIITLDSAVAHLAGAMNKPTWTLLTPVPNWRWTSEGDNTYWYDSMKLFRRKSPDDLKEVFEKVLKEFEVILGQ